MPDLTRLLVLEVGKPPARASSDWAEWANTALDVAVRGRLPLAAVADQLEDPDTPSWRTALAADAERSSVRRATLDAVTAALGTGCETVAVGAPAWRPLSGTDVDLLSPDVVATAQRLEQAGFLPVPAHDEPGRRVLVRCSAGRAVDLVDIEAVASVDIEAVACV